MPSQFSSGRQYPLTIKPVTPPTETEIHLDIFNIQNTLRMLFQDLDAVLADYLTEAPIDGQQYARQDGAWSVVVGGGGGGIPEAPSDGQLYGRKDAAWALVPTSAAATWGSITGTLSSQTDLQSALDGKEPTVASGVATQYYRGDKTWQTLDWAAIADKPSFAAVATSGAYADLTDKPTIPAAQVNSDWNATSGVAQILNKPNVRIQLTANRTYYVRTDGSDSNTGLTNTAGGAFLTIQKAVDVAATFDLNGYTVTIQVADGTYAEAIQFRVAVGDGVIALKGNLTTPANVIITSVAATTVPTRYTIEGFSLSNSTAVIRLNCTKSDISYGTVVFGVATYAHVASTAGGRVDCIGPVTIAANSPAHIYSATGGVVNLRNKTVTLTGTPAFSTGFVFSQLVGAAVLNGNTFVGSATGPRYNVQLNGVAFVNGAGATYLPGNAAGVVLTGGQYA